MLATVKLLLPALIPSWRFFKSVEPSPRIQWRASESETWLDFRPRPERISAARMTKRLFWSPGWNEALYAVSLAERLTLAPTTHAEDELFCLISNACPGEAFVTFRILFVTRDYTEVTFQSASRQVLP